MNESETDGKHPQWVGQYVPSARTSGSVWLRYTPREPRMINVATTNESGVDQK